MLLFIFPVAASRRLFSDVPILFIFNHRTNRFKRKISPVQLYFKNKTGNDAEGKEEMNFSSNEKRLPRLWVSSRWFSAGWSLNFTGESGINSP